MRGPGSGVPFQVMSREAPDLARSSSASVAVAVLLPALACVAAFARPFAGTPRYSAAAMFTVLTSMLLAAFAAFTWRSLPRAAAVAAPLALATVAPLACAAASAITTPIVDSARDSVRCGTPLIGLLGLVAPVGGLGLLLGAFVGGRLFGRRSADGFLGVAALVGVALAGVAATFGAARAGLPDPDTFLHTFDTAAVLRAGENAVIAGREVRYVEARGTGGGAADEVSTSNPVAKECRLEGAAHVDALTYADLDGACTPVVLRTDARRELLVAYASSDAEARYPLSAYRLPSFERATVTPRLESDRLAPPLGWTLSAAFGAVAGAALLVLARSRRRVGAALEGVDARHLGAGEVELEGGARVLVPDAAALPVGPVVLRDRADIAASYREAGTSRFDHAVAGTLAGLRGDERDRVASLHAMALAIAVVGATPLLVARIVAGL